MKVDADARWIRETYFSNPEQRVSIARDNVLIESGELNDRLYLVENGCLIGYRVEPDPAPPLELFRLRPGTYLGVYSYFSRTYVSSTRVVAKEDSTLWWIDRHAVAVDEDRLGSLFEQFMPVIIAELFHRQNQTVQAARERHESMRRLYQAEKMTTLGQMAAGLAHELNNAIGVITRNTEELAHFFPEILKRQGVPEYQWFERGKSQGQLAASAEIRARGREYEKRFRLSREQARLLARMAPDDQGLAELGGEVIRDPERAGRYWQAGRDYHDIQRAARHATAIVRGVRILGGRNHDRKTRVDIRQTLEEAMALLQSDLRTVLVRMELQPMPQILGDFSELVQVWVNLVKNACDALKQAGTDNPEIVIGSRVEQTMPTGSQIQVTIADNGPGIPLSIQGKLFEPSFTTKKLGLSFGLGLGLSIVQRIIESYGGGVQFSSQPGETIFRVCFPIHED